MTDFIKVFIPVFFIIFFFDGIFWNKFYRFKKIGKNPNVLPKADFAYGLIG